MKIEYTAINQGNLFYIKHGNCRSEIVGAIGGEGPPVPIPNTEVKLISAENTWLEAARENRAVPTQKELSEKCAFKHIFHLSHLLLTFYLLLFTSKYIPP